MDSGCVCYLSVCLSTNIDITEKGASLAECFRSCTSDNFQRRDGRAELLELLQLMQLRCCKPLRTPLAKMYDLVAL